MDQEDGLAACHVPEREDIEERRAGCLLFCVANSEFDLSESEKYTGLERWDLMLSDYVVIQMD